MTLSTCPSCGSGSRRPLAPGFYECTSQVLVDVVPAGRQGNLTDVPIYRACGHRYLAGPAATRAVPCACGLDSVGGCRDCGTRLCWRHIAFCNEVVRCAEHVRAAEQAKTADAARQRENYQRRVRDWEVVVVARLTAIADPVERFVRAVTEIASATTPELQGIIARQPSDRAIADWLIQHAVTPPTDTWVIEKRLFGPKSVQRPGWSFPNGSHAVYPFPHGDTGQGSINVLKDGRIYYLRSFEPQHGDRFNANAMNRLVEYVGLRPLDLPLRPYQLPAR